MEKRNILVTGGNRGIGLAAVTELAKNENDHIFLGCRDLEEGSRVASDIGENVKAVKLDVSTRDQLHQSISAILKDCIRIDVLINNAGVNKEGNFSDVSLEDYDQCLRVNTTAPLELIRAVVPVMEEHGYGRIVNVASGWGSFNEGLAGPFSYSVSKAALNAITMATAKSLSKNVKINSMCPGWVRTRMGGDGAPRTPEKGAETAVWLSNIDENGPNGLFFRDKEQIQW